MCVQMEYDNPYTYTPGFYDVDGYDKHYIQDDTTYLRHITYDFDDTYYPIVETINKISNSHTEPYSSQDKYPSDQGATITYQYKEFVREDVY